MSRTLFFRRLVNSARRPELKRARRNRLAMEALEDRTLLSATGADWMASVPDHISLFQMSLPGTHDTMTSTPISDQGAGAFNSTVVPAINNFITDDVEKTLPGLRALVTSKVSEALKSFSFNSFNYEKLVNLIVQTQTLSLADQLDAGIRALDIRVQEANDKLRCVHGEEPLGTLDFGPDVLQVATKFLADHPSETIVMSVAIDKAGSNNTKSVEQVFHDYETQINPLTGLQYRDYIWQPTWTAVPDADGKWHYNTTRVPANLGEARGKIIITQNLWPDAYNSAIMSEEPFQAPPGTLEPPFATNSIFHDPQQEDSGYFNNQHQMWDTWDVNGEKWLAAQYAFDYAAKNLPAPHNPSTFTVNNLAANKPHVTTSSSPGQFVVNLDGYPRSIAIGDGLQLTINYPKDVGDYFVKIFSGKAPLDIQLGWTTGGPSMNSRAEDYIKREPTVDGVGAPTGIVYTDFAPLSLIQTIYSHNPAMGGTRTVAHSDDHVLSYGQSTTLKAVVTPFDLATGGSVVTRTPGGSVTFRDGDAVLGVAPLTFVDGTNWATFTTSDLAVGSHTITATYSGDPYFFGSASVDPVSLVTTKAHLTVTAENQTMVYGGSAPTLTYTISGFQNGETLTTSGVTGTAGLGTTASATSNVGTYPIAVGLGDLHAGNYDFDLVNGMLTITPAPLTVTAADASKVYGQDVAAVLTGTISGIRNNDAITAVFSSLGAGVDAAPGTYAIDAVLYDGNSGKLTNYDTSIVPAQLTVTKDSTTAQVTSSASTINYGQSVTFTVTVTANAPGSGTPTGTVSFYDGGTLFGTSTLSGGAAALTVPKLNSGTHAITVGYNSDPNFLASQSAPFTQTVRSAAEQVALLSGEVNRLVKSGVLSSQEDNGLTPKLNAALASLNAGNVQAGVNQLNAFINHVNAMLKRPNLTQDQAQQLQALIDAATQAIESALA